MSAKVEDLLVFWKADGTYVGKLSEMAYVTDEMIISSLEYAPPSEYLM